jgi:hypothetical protein
VVRSQLNARGVRLQPFFELTTMLRRFTVALCFCASVSSGSEAQNDVADFHAHVVEFIRTRALRPLPAGDTLVTWNGDHPVLFHTASRDASGARGGMLRADAMLGITDVRWQGQTPTSFTTVWIVPKQSGVDSTSVRGSVSSNALRLSRAGQPDTALALPALPWAVADYGMDQLLLPAFDQLPPTKPVRLAVFRPYGIKWDTLTVTADERRKDWRVIRWTDTKGERWTLSLTQDGHMLWLRRSEHSDDEEHALEGSSLGERFLRLRGELLGDARP